MSVNLNLATLMRVIEDAQDKMPEGEYLAAMNALGALHRVVPAPAPAAAAVAVPVAAVGGAGAAGAVRVAAGSDWDGVPLAVPARANWREVMGQESYEVWCSVKFKLTAYRDLSGEAWMGLTQEEQNELNRRSIRAYVEKCKKKYSNPDPSVVPFISRHSVGSWGHDEAHTSCGLWTCVCGYKGKTVHWERHEKSERHQEWAVHRTVSRRIVASMRKQIERDEAGHFAKFKAPLTGGIQYFTTLQDRNEWT